MREFLNNANPLKTPERMLTVVGWGLALVFGLLLTQQDRSFEEVELSEPEPFSVTVREKRPAVDLTALDKEVYPAMDRARRRLQQRDSRRALAEISLAWTVCRKAELEPPAELHTLFADAMAQMVSDSRRRERSVVKVKTSTKAPVFKPKAKHKPKVKQHTEPALATRSSTIISVDGEWEPKADYPKAKKLPPRAPDHDMPPPPPPGFPEDMSNRGPEQGQYGPPRRPQHPGARDHRRPPGQPFPPAGMDFPQHPPRPGGDRVGRNRHRGSHYPGERREQPGNPRGHDYSDADSPPGY